jgi:hypothetical protein
VFRTKTSHILIVHQGEAIWVPSDPSQGASPIRQPLEGLLDGAGLSSQVPAGLADRPPALCIVPDHWFGIETYAFRSPKPALIEAFLERKLTAAHPDQPGIRHFFGYKRPSSGQSAEELRACFLLEPEWYRLYGNLQRLGIAPQRITAPAFLWEARLSQTRSDFSSRGTLLIHMEEREGRLYFFHQGHYIFSRKVALPDAVDRIQVLTYEINQSLYLFAQKAKRELERFYLVGGGGAIGGELAESLGRELVPLEVGDSDGVDGLPMGDLPFLTGLLSASVVAGRFPYFRVIHRQVKRELEWRPVQRVGLALGVLLVLLCAGGNLALQGHLKGAGEEVASLKSRLGIAGPGDLAAYEETLDQVLIQEARPRCADTLVQLLASLPAGAQPREIKLETEPQEALLFTALVSSGDARQLSVALQAFVEELRRRLPAAAALSINDIDIRADQAGDPSGYLIALRLELS